MGSLFWSKLARLDFKNKLTVVVWKMVIRTKHKTTPLFLGWITRNLKHLWKCSLEHRAFLHPSDPVQKSSHQPDSLSQDPNLNTVRNRVSDHKTTKARRWTGFERTPSRRYSQPNHERKSNKKGYSSCSYHFSSGQ